MQRLGNVAHTQTGIDCNCGKPTSLGMLVSGARYIQQTRRTGVGLGGYLNHGIVIRKALNNQLQSTYTLKTDTHDRISEATPVNTQMNTCWMRAHRHVHGQEEERPAIGLNTPTHYQLHHTSGDARKYMLQPATTKIL